MLPAGHPRTRYRLSSLRAMPDFADISTAINVVVRKHDPSSRARVSIDGLRYIWVSRPTTASGGTMGLAERADSFALLDNLFEKCSCEVSSVVVLDGALGSGKTSLLGAFAQRFVKEGALYLGATGSRAEQHLALGV